MWEELGRHAPPGAEAGGSAPGAAGGGSPQPGATEAAAARRAARIVNQARRRAHRLKEEALRKGWEAGYREGQSRALEAGREKVTQALAEIQAVGRQLILEREELLRAHTKGILDLAQAVARQILTEAVDAEPQRLLAMLARARAQFGGENGAVARLHPDDLERFASIPSPEARAASPVLQGLELVADPTLEPGDMILVSPRGTVDLRLEAQLKRLMETLADHLPAPGSGGGGGGSAAGS